MRPGLFPERLHRAIAGRDELTAVGYVTVLGRATRFLAVSLPASDVLRVAPDTLWFVRARDEIIVTPGNLIDVSNHRAPRRFSRSSGDLHVRFRDDRGVPDRVVFRPKSHRQLRRALESTGWAY